MKHIFFIVFLFFALNAGAQINTGDSGNRFKADTVQKDTVKKRAVTPKPAVQNRVIAKDSVKPHRDSTTSSDSATAKVSAQHNSAQSNYRHTPFLQKEFRFPKWMYGSKTASDASLIAMHSELYGSDLFFYCLLGILLLTGLIKLIFPKYFQQVFQFMLQPGVRRKNLRESNNAENAFPSVLLNLIFVITASLCITQLAKRDFSVSDDWKYWLWAAGAIAAIYLVKYIVIKISGWVFNEPNAASTYNYVVFSINKIVGVVLIPVIIFVAYGSASLTSVIYSASSIVLIALLAYRYIASFILLRGSLKVSAFHFFLYLCAIEIFPLLILYKVLLMSVGKVF